MKTLTLQSSTTFIARETTKINGKSNHGLRTPDEAFFHRNPEIFGSDRQIGQINSGAFGVFSPNYQHPFWYSESIVHVFHYSTIISIVFISTSQIFIWDWDLNLGGKWLGIKPSFVRSPCVYACKWAEAACRA